VCALLFTTVEAQRGIGDTIRDFINRILNREEGKEEITAIKDILENPEEYSNKTVTVEGILGGRIGYGWMRGDIYGIYDLENAEELEEYEMMMSETYEGPANIKGISVDLRPDFEKLNNIANGSFETYEKLVKEEYERVESMYGKKVRATGVIITDPYMTQFEEPAPLLGATSDTIEVIE
jgi:hypothetical protein